MNCLTDPQGVPAALGLVPPVELLQLGAGLLIGPWVGGGGAVGAVGVVMMVVGGGGGGGVGQVGDLGTEGAAVLRGGADGGLPAGGVGALVVLVVVEQQGLGPIDGGVQLRAGVQVLPVQVDATRVGPAGGREGKRDQVSGCMCAACF